MRFTNLSKGCRSKELGILIYYIGKGCFLSGHGGKGYQFQNVEHMASFAVLCSRIGTQLTSRRPPGAFTQ